MSSPINSNTSSSTFSSSCCRTAWFGVLLCSLVLVLATQQVSSQQLSDPSNENQVIEEKRARFAFAKRRAFAFAKRDFGGRAFAFAKRSAPLSIEEDLEQMDKHFDTGNSRSFAFAKRAPSSRFAFAKRSRNFAFA